MVNFGDDRLPARFWAKVVQDRAPGGCWLWTGSVSRKGYGRYGVGNRVTTYAHRVVYEALVGPIPEGHEIDHVRARGCVHRHCVRPEHLEAVTHAENVQRSAPAMATHCQRGHEFTPENTIRKTDGNGQRKCRECRNAGRRKRVA